MSGNYLLLVLCLLLEVGQILDIITTYIGLNKSKDIDEVNPFFKIKKNRRIPYFVIVIKCVLPFFFFFTLNILFVYVIIIFYVFLIIIIILDFVIFLVVLNNIFIYIR